MTHPNTDTHAVNDLGDGRKYWTQIPNIVLTLGLSPYALALYVHLKRTAGDRGRCWKATSTLSEETGMSAGAVSKAKVELEKCRPELESRSLIVIDTDNSRSGRPRHIITITDIWPENFKAQSSQAAPQNSPGELRTSSHEHQSSPGEAKKNPSEEKHSKKNHTHLRAADASAPAVVVGVQPQSKFSLEDSRRYAEHLHASGQGVTNPGGFARSIFKSGVEDAQITTWLASVDPERVRSGELEPTPRADTSKCPDCRGAGYYYPAEFDKGVKLCRHPRLTTAA
jgi:hypothetical protein